MSKISIGEISKLGIGFALGYLTYKLFSILPTQAADPEPQQQKQSQISTQQNENKAQLKQLEQLQQLLLRKSQKFQIRTQKLHEQILTKECVLEFFNQTIDIFQKNQVIKITQENRQARRKIFADIDQKYEVYFKFVCTLDQNMKYVLEKANKDFCAFLNLQFDRVVESIGYHMENDEMGEEDQEQNFRFQVVRTMAASRQALMNCLPLFNSPISGPQLQKILKFQSQSLSSRQQYLLDLIKKLGIETKQEQQTIPLFITCYIEDLAYQEFQIESEQMNIGNEEMNEQITKAFSQWNLLRENVIRYIHDNIQDDIIIRD